MAANKFKAKLIEAREAIKSKDFVVVTNICKEILKYDPQNYNAWVFLGVAAQETNKPDKAIAAFNRAISISPTQILAWQGLRSFYENETSLDHWEELIDVYHKFIDLYKDDHNKLMDTFYRLSAHYKKLGKVHTALDTLNKALSITGTDLFSNNANLWNAMALWLLEQDELEQDQYAMLKTAMDKVCEGKLNKFTEFEEWSIHSFEKYLGVLLETKRYKELVEFVDKMKKIFQNEPLLTKWHLHAFISSCVDSQPLLMENFDDVCGRLAEETPENHSFVNMAQGAKFFTEKKWLEARDRLLTGLKDSNWCWESWLLLCWTLEILSDAVHLQHCAIEGLKALNSSSRMSRRKSTADLRFKFCLGKDLIMRGLPADLDKCITVLTETLQDPLLKPESLYLQGVAYLKLQRWSKVEEILKSLHQYASPTKTALEGMLNLERNKLEEAKHLFQTALQTSPDNGEWQLQLGIVFWKLKDHTNALNYFLKAVKSNPYSSKGFLMLGHYFRDIAVNLKQALRCYKLAHDLNKFDEEIAVSLCGVYESLNEEEEALNLLNAITRNSHPGSFKWAWLRLGLIYLRREHPALSIRAFQTALCADSTDRELWQCLAEAYLLQGSYNAALKAFNKTLELEPQLVYCTYQIANIKLMLGDFEDAAKKFREVVHTLPLYTPALKGLGEAYLARARFYLKNCISSKVVEFCELALEYFTKALEQKPEFVCLWKLLGDTATLLAQLSPDVVNVGVPSSLKNFPAQSSERLAMNQKEILEVGSRCYLAAIHWASNNSNLWHDLGVNYYYRGLTESDISIKSKHLKNAAVALKKAVSLKSTDGSHWNALGVILSADGSVKHYQLAQNAFIKAVKAEPYHCAAWANLGTLYLKNDAIKLANQAFASAQSIDPTYVNSWIGQAMIAETLAHEDSMDLFRHCTIIGNHTEGCVGYASWVCSTLLKTPLQNTEVYRYNIEQMNAIPAASDCLFRFIDIIRDNGCAFNMLGLLLERQGLLNEARKAFKRAFQLLEPSTDVDVMDTVRCNLARVSRKLGLIQEAVVEGSLVKKSNFYNHCELAACYYQLGQLEDSRSAYESALQWLADTDEQRSHLMVAMAAIAYQLQNSDEAKTLLFESFRIKPVCVQGLLALCALGVLSSDFALASATIDELDLCNGTESFRQASTYLRACHAVMEDNYGKAKSIYCKAIHMWPKDSELWKLLSKFLLKLSLPSLAIHCAKTAIKMSDSPALDILQYLTVCYQFCGLENEGLTTAKKLIHYYPGEENNWRLLKGKVYLKRFISDKL